MPKGRRMNWMTFEVPSSAQSLWSPGNKDWKTGMCVKEMLLFTPVQSGAWLVKGENTLKKSGNGFMFSHFPSVLYLGSMCQGAQELRFHKQGLRRQEAHAVWAVFFPRLPTFYKSLSFSSFLVSHPLASGTVKFWQALESRLFGLNKQLNEVLFSCFCPELEEGELKC